MQTGSPPQGAARQSFVSPPMGGSGDFPFPLDEARKRNKHSSRLTPASVAPPSRAVRGVADLPTPPAATDERRPHLAQPPCPRLARLRDTRHP